MHIRWQPEAFREKFLRQSFHSTPITSVDYCLLDWYDISALRELESLDLSNNYLTGKIPSSQSDLTFLSYLNLSYNNNLSGRIPSGQQPQTLNNQYMYIGNPGLCGPLPNNCFTNEMNPYVHQGQEATSHSQSDFCLSMNTGFVRPIPMGSFFLFFF